MNVILIMADTWRRDHLGCYGNEWIQTPNIDKLAAKGTIFENYYFGSYPTLPCRNDILTGKYEFPWRGWSGPEADATTLSGLIDEADQISYFITDIYHHWRRGGGSYWWDFSGFELIRGQERDKWITDADIDIEDNDPEYRELFQIRPHLKNTKYLRQNEDDWFSPQVFTRAARWLQHNAAHQDFFLMIDSFDPHEPWDPPRYYTDLYGNSDYDGIEYITPDYREIEGYLTEEEFKHVQAMYAGEITMVDNWLGRLLDQVETMGLMDNTMIIFATDHGTYNGDHGFVGKNRTLYQGLAHIPMIIYHPEFGQGQRIKQLVQPLDIFSTVLEATGVDIPKTIHGKSLFSLLKNEKIDWRKTALFGQHDNWCNLTDGNYVLHNQVETGKTLLFDLTSDPDESNNLTESQSRQLDRMQKLLKEKLMEIKTPEELIQKLKL